MKLNATKRLTAGRGTGLGAGVIFVCPSTRRALFVKRSADSESPGTWCGLGGGVEQGETIEEGLRREVMEEGGYTEPFIPVKFDESVQGDFTFHNFYSLVDEEFTPVLNDEHTEYVWTDKVPKPMHPKLLESMRRYNRSK